MSAEHQCAPWCIEGSPHHRGYKLRADQNCWGPDHSVVLGLEDGAPATHLSHAEMLELDPPRITACAWRQWYGLPIVYLHAYRPSSNPHEDLDVNLKLTPFEAVELANHLISVVETIGAA